LSASGAPQVSPGRKPWVLISSQSSSAGGAALGFRIRECRLDRSPRERQPPGRRL